MQLNSESAQRRAIAEALLEIALFVIRQTSASREVSLSAAATLATLSLDPPTHLGVGVRRWPSGCDFVPLS